MRSGAKVSSRPAAITARRHFSDDEFTAFGRDGFVVVRGLCGAGAMAAIIVWADEVQARPETPGKEYVFRV